MGSRYTTAAASGFNASPPSDDGTQTAANLVTWAGVKTKLADPTKNLADAINTALVTAMDYSVRQITGSDAIAASDHMKTVEIAPSVSVSPVSVTLADAATMTSNFIVRIRNSSLINQTIARATGGDTIDGVAGNIILPPKASVTFSTNAAADGYLTIGYSGPRLDTDPLVVGSSDGTKKVRFEADGLTTGNTRVITVPDSDLTLPVVTTGSTASTFTFDGSGGDTGSLTLNWQKMGNWVTLNIPAAQATTGTGSTTLQSNTALAAAVRPAGTQDFPCNDIRNNGGASSDAGIIRIGSNGIINIFRNGIATAFADGASGGTHLAISVTYFIG